MKSESGHHHDLSHDQSTQFDEAIEKIINEHLKWMTILDNLPKYGTPEEIRTKHESLSKHLRATSIQLNDWHRLYKYYLSDELFELIEDYPSDFIDRLNKDLRTLYVAVERARKSSIMPHGTQKRISPQRLLLRNIIKAYEMITPHDASSNPKSIFHSKAVFALEKAGYLIKGKAQKDASRLIKEELKDLRKPEK